MLRNGSPQPIIPERRRRVLFRLDSETLDEFPFEFSFGNRTGLPETPDWAHRVVDFLLT